MRRSSRQLSNLIEDTVTNGPAGYHQLRALTTIVGRRIRVWQTGRLIYVFGRCNGRNDLDVEYQPGQPVGHWCLRDGREPSTCRSAQFNCLYDCVASQTGHLAIDLRCKTARTIRRWRNKMRNEPPNVLLGGARYTGRSAHDAAAVLDASQHGQCHPEGRSGHPRGHASYPSGSRGDDSVEAYSYSRWRSGFLSRSDQDLVCHHTLVTDSAKWVMDRLNGGEFKVASHIDKNELDYDPLPLAQIWSSGSPQGSPSSVRTVCLVGKHFLNRHSDVYADLFVLTFYPII